MKRREGSLAGVSRGSSSECCALTRCGTFLNGRLHQQGDWRLFGTWCIAAPWLRGTQVIDRTTAVGLSPRVFLHPGGDPQKEVVFGVPARTQPPLTITLESSGWNLTLNTRLLWPEPRAIPGLSSTSSSCGFEDERSKAHEFSCSLKNIGAKSWSAEVVPVARSAPPRHVQGAHSLRSAPCSGYADVCCRHLLAHQMRPSSKGL